MDASFIFRTINRALDLIFHQLLGIATLISYQQPLKEFFSRVRLLLCILLHIKKKNILNVRLNEMAFWVMCIEGPLTKTNELSITSHWEPQ